MNPNAGRILLGSTPWMLHQHQQPTSTDTVGKFLGVEAVLQALHRLDTEDWSAKDLEILEGNWDIQERLARTMADFGLSSVKLTRPLSTLSGGQQTALGIVSLLLHRPAIALLDEPTNNLDSETRTQFFEALAYRKGTTIIASHDRELVGRVDRIFELSDRELAVIDGPYSAYLDYRAVKEKTAAHAYHTATKTLKQVKAERKKIEQRQARQRTTGQRANLEKRGSKMSMNGLKGKSQASAGRELSEHTNRLERAASLKAQAEENLPDRSSIRLYSLLTPAVHTHSEIVRLCSVNGRVFSLGGAQRVALLGRNGVGKSRLIASMSDTSLRSGVPAWAVPADHATHRIGVLAQNALDLQDAHTLFEELRLACPQASEMDIRALLARLLFRGDSKNKRVGELSGGERFRIS